MLHRDVGLPQESRPSVPSRGAARGRSRHRVLLTAFRSACPRDRSPKRWQEKSPTSEEPPNVLGHPDQPNGEALHVSYELVEAIDEFVEDFDIRYCCLEPSAEAIAALRRVRARGDEEQLAIDRLIAELERGEPVDC